MARRGLWEGGGLEQQARWVRSRHTGTHRSQLSEEEQEEEEEHEKGFMDRPPPLRYDPDTRCQQPAPSPRIGVRPESPNRGQAHFPSQQNSG